jgi:hypothetical protein
MSVNCHLTIASHLAERPAEAGARGFPRYVDAVAGHFSAAFPPEAGYRVRTRDDSTEKENSYHVFVHRGLTTGFWVTLSSHRASPSNLAIKVQRSSRVGRFLILTWVVLSAAFSVGLGIFLAVRLMLDGKVPLIGDTIRIGRMREAVLFTTFVFMLLVWGGLWLDWTLSRAVAILQGNLFGKARLLQILETIKGILA